MVAVGAAAGNHLSEEPGKEQQNAYDECHEGKIEHRLLRYGPVRDAVRLLDQFFYNDPDCQYSAYKKGEKSGKPE